MVGSFLGQSNETFLIRLSESYEELSLKYNNKAKVAMTPQLTLVRGQLRRLGYLLLDSFLQGTYVSQ